ncbi:MAG: 5'/3'-nucleotidase SurE [Armatimonadetes bacterium]|nr:5'/3'-nucleotidase SurE [Armatimonadota bacterium]
MRILITNDDGVRAEGISVLAAVAQKFGEVKIVAPDREKSACGHGMTLHDPLRVKPVDWARISDSWDRPSVADAFEVNGLPVDCVNVGLTVGWPDGCDLILSGINNGPNLGFDVTYSGTVAGAMEGAINHVRSISVSMALFVSGAPLHFDSGAQWLSENLGRLIETPMKPLTFLNVNIPAVSFVEIRGTRVVGMGKRVYEDRVEERSDPWGRKYYWQGGVVVMDPNEEDTDVKAVSEGFVSVTPVSLDWTDHALASAIRAGLER